MISFTCACGQPMTVRPEFAGRQGNCPRCKRPFTVPLQSVVPASATPPPRPTTPLPIPGAAPLPIPPQRPGAPPPRPPAASGAAGPPAALPAGMTQPLKREQVLAGPAQRGGPAPARPGPSGGARLEVVHGPPGVVGKTYALNPGRRTVLGRDPAADVSIPSDRISRRHCQFEASGDGVFVVEDLGSSNGTLVNQARIQARTVLLGGEYIQTGDCLLRFCE